MWFQDLTSYTNPTVYKTFRRLPEYVTSSDQSILLSDIEQLAHCNLGPD